jgi:hypothetical protein
VTCEFTRNSFCNPRMEQTNTPVPARDDDGEDFAVASISGDRAFLNAIEQQDARAAALAAYKILQVCYGRINLPHLETENEQGPCIC